VRNFVAPDRQKTFLRFLRTHLLNVTAACRSSGLAGTASAYLQRRNDEDFRRRWEQIEEEVLDQLESSQWRAAKEDSTDRRWTLKRRRATRWSERRQISPTASTTEQCDVVHLSDEDLIRIAEGKL
jgi:hypothetical protein